MNTENIGKWSLDALENVSVGDFNNVSDKSLAVFPGQKEGDSIFNVQNKTVHVWQSCRNDFVYGNVHK